MARRARRPSKGSNRKVEQSRTNVTERWHGEAERDEQNRRNQGHGQPARQNTASPDANSKENQAGEDDWNGQQVDWARQPGRPSGEHWPCRRVGGEQRNNRESWDGVNRILEG
jgi:hypothetical protein